MDEATRLAMVAKLDALGTPRSQYEKNHSAMSYWPAFYGLVDMRTAVKCCDTCTHYHDRDDDGGCRLLGPHVVFGELRVRACWVCDHWEGVPMLITEDGRREMQDHRDHRSGD